MLFLTFSFDKKGYAGFYGLHLTPPPPLYSSLFHPMQNFWQQSTARRISCSGLREYSPSPLLLFGLCLHLLLSKSPFKTRSVTSHPPTPKFKKAYLTVRLSPKSVNEFREKKPTKSEAQKLYKTYIAGYIRSFGVQLQPSLTLFFFCRRRQTTNQFAC